MYIETEAGKLDVDDEMLDNLAKYLLFGANRWSEYGSYKAYLDQDLLSGVDELPARVVAEVAREIIATSDMEAGLSQLTRIGQIKRVLENNTEDLSSWLRGSDFSEHENFFLERSFIRDQFKAIGSTVDEQAQLELALGCDQDIRDAYVEIIRLYLTGLREESAELAGKIDEQIRAGNKKVGGLLQRFDRGHVERAEASPEELLASLVESGALISCDD